MFRGHACINKQVAIPHPQASLAVVNLPAGNGLVLLDDIDVAVIIQEEVPLNDIGEAGRGLLIRVEQVFQHVTHADAHGLVRDLEVVFL